MGQIILISGYKRAGKDTIAAMLEAALTKLGKSAQRIAFAEPLKHIGSTALNVSLEQLDTFKNDPDRYKLQIVDTQSGNLVHGTNCRSYLQLLGTEAVKSVFGDSVWADIFYERAKASVADYIIATDFRFNVEWRYDTRTIRVISDNYDLADLHVSERELDNFKFDYTINNHGYQVTQAAMDAFAQGLINEY